MSILTLMQIHDTQSTMRLRSEIRTALLGTMLGALIWFGYDLILQTEPFDNASYFAVVYFLGLLLGAVGKSSQTVWIAGVSLWVGQTVATLSTERNAPLLAIGLAYSFLCCAIFAAAGVVTAFLIERFWLRID